MASEPHDPWEIIDAYFSAHPYFLTQHHLDSYNHFVSHKIPLTIKSMNPFVIVKTHNGTPIQIHVYIGGQDTTGIYLNKPTINSDLQSDDSILDNIEDDGDARNDGASTSASASISAGASTGTRKRSSSQQPLYPNVARLRDMTYASELLCDILVQVLENDTVVHSKTFPRVRIGIIPVMLHSALCHLQNQPASVLSALGECPYDQGGYFIVTGKEKTILSQERNATNKLFIARSKDARYSFEGFIRCTSTENSVFPKTVYVHVFSRAYSKGVRADAIEIVVPHISIAVPLFVLFRALGVENDRDIMNMINPDADPHIQEFLAASATDGNIVYTQAQAHAYLQAYVEYKSLNQVQYILLQDLFPNTDNDLTAKALFLSYIANKVARTCLGMLPEVDRDNYMFKRVHLSGMMLADIFKDFYNAFRNHCRSAIDREYETGPWKVTNKLDGIVNQANQMNIFSARPITEGMYKSMKGNWGLTNNDEDKGIVQDLSRISYAGTCSHLRRVNTPIDRTSKIVAPHRLHGSQWGVMCPVESPDGANIGLLKHMSLLCAITFDQSMEPVWDALLQHRDELGLIPLQSNITPRDIRATTKLLLNNTWKAVTHHPDRVTAFLRTQRRAAQLPHMMSVSWNILEREINVLLEGGRCCRPLLLVDMDTQELLPVRKNNGKGKGKEKANDEPKNAWDQWGDVMEYVDVEEANNCRIAMTPRNLTEPRARYTHCEIHPSTIFSTYTATIPLANHNQAPRNIFSGAQGKQAIGVYATSFNNRIDTMSYVLHYPQRSLVGTRYKDYLSTNALPNGENLIIAIATYTGYNQEDSVIINASSVQRGMFNLSYFKSYIEEEVDEGHDGSTRARIVFANPLTAGKGNTPANGIKKGTYYDTLDERGFPKLNAHISKDDAIIGKVLISKHTGDEGAGEVVEDRTAVADKTLSGFVDKVYVYKANDTLKCKVRFRKVRAPELGDKMASSHGQKGVVGLIVPQHNMPFTKDGLVPDAIINPHAIPSRMTLGHLIECLVSKACTSLGTTFNGTPFEDQNEFAGVFAELERRGMNRHGDEILYDGHSGHMMQSEIFIGPTYYFRLKHMVADKINHRSTGPKTALTHQPTQGRGNDGGLRIGLMEENVIISHGMSSFMKESFMERSDNYMYMSDTHQDRTLPLAVPYAFKLFMQELQTMSVNARLSVEELETVPEDGDDNGMHTLIMNPEECVKAPILYSVNPGEEPLYEEKQVLLDDNWYQVHM